MNSFAIANPKDFAEAATLLADKRFTLPVLKAGGMDVVDHLKEGLIEPDVLINIKRIRSEGKAPVAIESAAGKSTIRLEATALLVDVVESPQLAQAAPVLGQSLANAATPQVRNVATVAGNLLQRPRCWYYRNDQFECLKKGGSQCFAAEGENAYHAIFGPGPCHIVHPSNLAPALWVCDAVVHLTGGKRASLPIGELYHMPETGIKSEHVLEPGEIITHITCEAPAASGFWTIKAKASFDWPLAFAAVALTIENKRIRAAKVCAGAVAPTPWPLPKIAEALVGVSIEDEATITSIAARSAEGAKPMSDNAYKLKLLPVAVKRAILRAAGRQVDAELGVWA